MFNISIYKNIFGSCIKGDSSSFLNSYFPLSSIDYLPYLPLLHSFCSSALLSLPFIVFPQSFFPLPSSLLPLLILPFFSFMVFSFSPSPITFSSPPFFCPFPPENNCGHSGKHKNTQFYAWAWSPEHLSNKPHIQYWFPSSCTSAKLGMPYMVCVLVTQKSTFFPAQKKWTWLKLGTVFL